MSATTSPNTVTYFEIGTAQPDAVRAFYGEVFGWDFGVANPGGYATINDTAGGLWDSSGIGGDAWAIFYVEVADVHATIAEATSRGAEVVRGPVDNGVIVFAHLADPTGNRFGLWHRKSAD